MDDLDEIPADVEEALRRQDEAMALLSRLRTEEPYRRPRLDTQGAQRREFRRWPLPEGVALERHDGSRWQALEVVDMGVGGARIRVPLDMPGPFPARLKAPSAPAVLVLADFMWKDAKTGIAGLRFEFHDDEEREVWSGGLIDALLARHAVS